MVARTQSCDVCPIDASVVVDDSSLRVEMFGYRMDSRQGRTYAVRKRKSLYAFQPEQIRTGTSLVNDNK